MTKLGPESIRLRPLLVGKRPRVAFENRSPVLARKALANPIIESGAAGGGLCVRGYLSASWPKVAVLCHAANAPRVRCSVVAYWQAR